MVYWIWTVLDGSSWEPDKSYCYYVRYLIYEQVHSAISIFQRSSSFTSVLQRIQSEHNRLSICLQLPLVVATLSWMRSPLFQIQEQSHRDTTSSLFIYRIHVCAIRSKNIIENILYNTKKIKQKLYAYFQIEFHFLSLPNSDNVELNKQKAVKSDKREIPSEKWKVF